ncbi:MAG: hypothetical protein ACQEWM_08080 [Actinomycetota bacterium]
MSKRRMSGAAAGFVLVLVVTTGGALQPGAVSQPHGASPAGKHAAGWSLVQAETGPQQVFWDRLCRMLGLCG